MAMQAMETLSPLLSLWPLRAYPVREDCYFVRHLCEECPHTTNAVSVTTAAQAASTLAL